LAQQHEAAKALPILRHAAEVLHTRLGEDHVETQRAWKRLLSAQKQSAS
jgi:hypothetical protein